MAAEEGHEPNRVYVDQSGNFHLNGASIFNDAEDDVSAGFETLDQLSTTELAWLDGVTAGTATASKAVVLGASKEIATITSATITTLTTSNLTMAAVARTATADGLTTGTIADAGRLQHVTVTSADANHIIVLPTPTPGTIVTLASGATGFELRTSAPNTVAINGGTGSAGESAIAASTLVIAVCTSATTWQAIQLAGTTLAAVEAAAN